MGALLFIAAGVGALMMLGGGSKKSREGGGGAVTGPDPAGLERADPELYAIYQAVAVGQHPAYDPSSGTLAERQQALYEIAQELDALGFRYEAMTVANIAYALPNAAAA